MFSNSTSDISHILPKSATFKDKSISNGSMRNGAKSIENIFSADFNTPTRSLSSINGTSGSSKKKKAMSMENLDDYTDDDNINNNNDNMDEIKPYTPVNRPMTLHSRPPLLNLNRAQSVEQLMSSPILPLRPPQPTTAPISLERRISFNGYTNLSSQSNEEIRQKSIANIIENRKKNISKLRGLVIPDKVPEHEIQTNQKLFDLPVIRSKECDLIKNISPTPTSVSVRKTFSEFESAIRPTPRTMLKKVCLTCLCALLL